MWHQMWCCLTHQIVTLSSSTTIITAPVCHECLTQHLCKQGNVVGMHTRQRELIDFLTMEGSSLIEISRDV